MKHTFYALLQSLVIGLVCSPAHAQSNISSHHLQLTSGVRIELPFCAAPYPSRSLAVSPRGVICSSQPLTCQTSGFYLLPMDRFGNPAATPARMDWGGDNAVSNVVSARCNVTAGDTRAVDQLRISPLSGGGPLVQLTGFISNVTSSFVEGEIVYGVRGTTQPLTLALEVQQDSGAWVDLSTVVVRPCDVAKDIHCDQRIATISGYAPGNSNVRLELRVAAGFDPKLDLYLYAANLFGAECFPDVANPGMCLP